jgi:hypothetical protein
MYALNEKGVPISRPRLEKILIWLKFEYRYARAFAAMRFGAASWHAVLGAVLCSYGYYWGAALLPVAVLEVWAGHRLQLAAQAQAEQGYSRRGYQAQSQNVPTAHTVQV